MNQPRVLIVDDDAALLQALPEALRLRMREVTVDTADSAAAALERIAARDYDAVVTDIKMPGMDGLTLMADDDPALLQALPEALRLRMRGVTVDTADSAAAALDRIAARPYDAIVTDIKMPGMDGFALLAQIQARHPDTPILMITGHGEYDLAVRALRGGAYDFMEKPIDRDDFVAALYRAIRAHASNRRMKDRQLALERCTSELEAIVEKLGGSSGRRR